jgi:MerR family transcriptional regulator, heat shock protein HspR
VSNDGKRRRRGTTARVDATFDEQRGVFMISVAAELAEMHPQTLRMYEARGLITPKRSPKNTRLYSFEDVERLRRIQQMTAQEGLNLAGVETVLELEAQLARARVELGRMRERAAALEGSMLAEIDRVRRSFRAEIVPYGAYDAHGIHPAGSRSSSAGIDGDADGRGRPIRIPVKRRRRK